MQDTPGTLYAVATPIGNLGDMTMRAIDTLKHVDVIACEDTRVTAKLLHHFSIDTKTISYHHHTREDKTEHILRMLVEGKNVAVVTDAGTPGVSDPGNKLVSEAIGRNISVVPIPGVSALSAIISVAGIDMQNFLFMAYPPHKKGRKTFFERVAVSGEPVIYYDSVHRVIKNLRLLCDICGNARVIVGRELTKLHEEIVRGTAEEVIAYYENNADKVRGEFVIIVEK